MLQKGDGWIMSRSTPRAGSGRLSDLDSVGFASMGDSAVDVIAGLASCEKRSCDSGPQDGLTERQLKGKIARAADDD